MAKKAKKVKKSRPPRVYQDTKGIKANIKKIHIKTNLSNRQLVKVIINNFKKETRKRKKKQTKEPKEEHTDTHDGVTTDKIETDKPDKTNTDLNRIAYFLMLNKKDDENRDKQRKDKEDKETNKIKGEIIPAQQRAIEQQHQNYLRLDNKLNRNINDKIYKPFYKLEEDIEPKVETLPEEFVDISAIKVYSNKGS